jgi:hypothetical protein
VAQADRDEGRREDGLTTDERTELNRLRDEEPAPSFSLPTKHVSKSNETYCQRRRSSGASLHDRHYIRR